MKNTWIEAKMEGAGNSFVILAFKDQRSYTTYLNNLGTELNREAHRLCREHNVDGAVFLSEFKQKSPHYKWDFYNADGSVAEMCGNAARCVTAFSVEKELAPKKHEFLTLSGKIKAKYIEEGQTAVELSPVKGDVCVQSLNLGSSNTEYYFVNSGVPHVVIPVSDIIPQEIRSLAKTLRGHKQFFPHGTNVSFYSEANKNRINAISFERGVEDFTLACGTGAVACAYVYKSLKKAGELIEVSMPGGELKVDLSTSKPLLIGPVKYI